MCFFTLTYDNLHLPTLPESVYVDPVHDFYTDVGSLVYHKGKSTFIPPNGFLCNSRGIPCFSRDDIEDFTHHMRDWFLSCGHNDVQYFICSEFGDTTQRPHYHGIYVVPPNFDTRALFERIRRFWYTGYYYKQGFKHKFHEPKGFVFPRYYEGGVDENGYNHKPFVVDSPNSAMRYIAKYVTKDLAFYKFLASQDLHDIRFNKKCRAWRRCMPFHVQTRSLGKLFVDKLTDDEKLDLLERGAYFLGDKQRRAVPRYIKEKILFTPFYRTKGYRRQVLRFPTPFLQENYQKVFRIKCNFQDKVFKRHLDFESFKKDCSPNVKDFKDYCSLYDSASKLASPYGGLSAWKVAYFGQPFKVCYVPFLGDSSEYWIERYKPFSTFQPYRLNRRESGDFRALSGLVNAMDWLSSRMPKRRSKAKEELDKTRDWWKHREYLDLIA